MNWNHLCGKPQELTIIVLLQLYSAVECLRVSIKFPYFGSQCAILKSNPRRVTNISDSSLTSWTDGGGSAMATPMKPITEEGDWLPPPPVRWLKWLWATEVLDFFPDDPWVLLLLLWLGTWGRSLPKSNTTRYPEDWKEERRPPIITLIYFNLL